MVKAVKRVANNDDGFILLLGLEWHDKYMWEQMRSHIVRGVLSTHDKLGDGIEGWLTADGRFKKHEG